MLSLPLPSVHSHPRQRVLGVVLAVVLLASVLAGPGVAVAGAQAANETNTTASANTSSPAPPSTSGASTSGTSTPPANESQNTTQPTNATPTTSARAGGNTSRLSPSNSTAVRNQTALTNWVKKLSQMNASQAKQAVDNNPKKAAKMANALQQLGVQNANKTVHQQPRTAARKVVGLLSSGNTSANSTAQNQTNASAAGGGSKQVKLRKCSGGFIESAMCKASNFLFGWIIGGIVSFVQGIITGIVNMIFGMPVPKHNGNIAIFQPPTNPPWSGLHNSWWTEAVPLGLLEWVLMVFGVMFTQVFTSDPSAELKLRELRNRSWKVLFGILGSWAIGAIILFVVNGVILTIAPDGKDIASNLAVFAGSVGAAGAAGLLIWFFEGILFLFVFLLVLVQKASVFVLMWSLPVLLPLAAFDVGPVKLFSKPARGIIDLLTQMIFVTLPMALVLNVGYVVLNGLNNSPIAQFGMWASGANTALTLGFWILAAVSPLFVFSQTGRMKGMAAGLLGVSIASNSGGLQEKVEDAKDRVPDANPPPNVTETTDINDGKNEGTHGGPLPGGDGSDKPSMLDAGTEPEQTDGPELPGPGGASADADTSTSSASAGTDSATSTSSRQTEDSNPVVSSEDVTEVNHPSDLPDETKYQVGQVKDGGEFEPVRESARFTRSSLLNGTYNKLNSGTRKYEDENLLLRSKEDGSFYDMDSMTYREQSYEQMSKDTSEDVLNS